MYDVFNILSVWGVDVCTVVPTFFKSMSMNMLNSYMIRRLNSTRETRLGL